MVKIVDRDIIFVYKPYVNKVSIYEKLSGKNDFGSLYAEWNLYEHGNFDFGVGKLKYSQDEKQMVGDFIYSLYV